MALSSTITHNAAGKSVILSEADRRDRIDSEGSVGLSRRPGQLGAGRFVILFALEG
jgi:hypothetical protein